MQIAKQSWMLSQQHRKKTKAFSLLEVSISIIILTVTMLIVCVTVNMSQTQRAKARDQEIMQDFLIHYVETLQGLAFNNIAAGTPVNTLFDGSHGSPLVALPSSGTWDNLESDNYQVFHPDLVWFENRNPKLRVTLTTTVQGGVDHTKHLCIETQWDPPANKGGKQTLRVDTLRIRDL